METKKNNFKSYQTEKVANRLVMIQEKLSLYKKKKVSFKNITEMAQTLSEHITKQEGTSCSSSTILRNQKYKGLIEDYLYSQEGFKLPGGASNLIAELTLSNIERENQRLKQYIASLERELDEIKSNKTKNIPVLEKNGSYLNIEEHNSANVKKALNLLIKHFEGLVALNEDGDLIDLTKKVNNVIVRKLLLK